MKYFTIFIILCCIGLIGGCRHSQKISTEELIRQKESLYMIPSDKSLQFDPIKPVVYQGAKLRDPFELPSTARIVKQYPDTILRTYSLDSLRLIGVVHHEKKQLAIFRTAQGKIYRLMVGSRVGIQNAVITHIGENEVKFTEEVNTPNGVKMRNVVMYIQQSELIQEKE